MASLKAHILKAIFYNSQNGNRAVPASIIKANCYVAGFDDQSIRAELDRLVEEGELRKVDDGYMKPAE